MAVTSATTATPEPSRAGAVRMRAAAALLGAGVAVHAYVAPEHLTHGWSAGAFFLVVAAMQALIGLALLRRAGTPSVLAAVGLSAALVVLYVCSRTVALPLPGHGAGAHAAAGHAATGGGDHAVGGRGNGVPIFPDSAAAGVGAVGAVDLIALLAELGVIVVLLTALPAPWPRRVGNALLLGAALLVGVRAAALG